MVSTSTLTSTSSPAAADPFASLLARRASEHQLYDVVWELTHRCNLDCVMCYNVRQPRPELTTDECLDILDQLAAAGVLRLTFTGGEILARPDFFAIAGRARALDFALMLKTNGALLTPALADRIAVLDPMQVDISLLGATAETFDAMARRPGAFARVIAAVRLLTQRGVRVKLNTLLLRRNVAERQAMIDLAAALGASHEQVYKIAPADDGRHKADDQQLSLAAMISLLEMDHTPFTPRMLASGMRTCKVGLSSCLISAYGTVYPCVELRIPAGDLRRQRFNEIWAHAPILRELRDRHTIENLPDCRDCPLSLYCEGRCAGLAWKEHGDPYGGHRLACVQAQARYAQQHPGAAIPDPPRDAP